MPSAHRNTGLVLRACGISLKYNKTNKGPNINLSQFMVPVPEKALPNKTKKPLFTVCEIREELFKINAVFEIREKLIKIAPLYFSFSAPFKIMSDN